MAEKLIHRVSDIGQDGSGYMALEHIPTAVMDAGDIILVQPGTYNDPNTANVDGMIVMGVGDRDTVFSGFTVPEGAVGTVVLKNLTIDAPGLTIGNSAVTVNVYDCTILGTVGNTKASALVPANAAVTKGVAVVGGKSANSTLVIENSTLGNSDTATGMGIKVDDYGTVTLRGVRVQADVGVFTNAAAVVEHCTFTGANAYAITIAAPVSAPAMTVRASVSAAANAGNNTETVVALIS
jgi:hypothetical protein